MNISSKLRAARVALAVMLVSCAISGCYLVESAQGQLAVMSKREPINTVIERPSTSPVLRAQLRAVRSIRDFASRELGLPDNGSYRSYADVGRPYVVWNVVAAPEFAVDAEEWCYPVVGCVAYRGYFAERRAQAFAESLREQGLDVTVGGVAAYSTLGHFSDPILNTMVGWDDVELAGIIFHELTHQLVYLPNDASFNEAFATTVEEEGVRRWLLAQGRGEELRAHLLQQQHYLAVIALLARARAELRTLYASSQDPAIKRAGKQAVFTELHENYAVLKRDWVGRGPFDRWFAGTLNNAHLASIATYYDCVPGFERELATANGDLALFYRRVQALAQLRQRARDAVVCPPLLRPN